MVNPIESLKNFKSSLSQLPTKYRLWTSIGILTALLIALPVTLIGLTTGSFELRKRAATFEPGPTPTPVLVGCGESCGDDQDCQEGLMCGTPCPPNQVCAQYMRCYNPNCQYDQDCICPTPTGVQITPTPTPTCTPEGKSMPVYPGYQCCSGLTAISTAKLDASGNCPTNPPIGASVCAKCGNKICGPGENKCNCPQDCLLSVPTITLIPTLTPTPKPTPVPPRKCPGTCLPNFLCRLLRGKCASGYTCPSSRSIFSNCCCLRPSK